MSTTIAGNGNYLEVTISGVVRLTVPKNKTVLRVEGSELKIDHDGKYSKDIQFSDVTSPATANIEALRVAVKNILNT